jgi:N-acetylmuramoyl-L-alanine amidase
MNSFASNKSILEIYQRERLQLQQCFRFLYAFFFCCLLLAPRLGFSAEKKDSGSRAYSALRAEFFSLRNSDIRREKKSERELLIQKFLRFQKTYPQHEDAPLALLDAAILKEELSASQGGASSSLFEAYALLADIERIYPQSKFVDDALLRKAEFLERHNVTSEERFRVYRDILQRFPNSDSAKEARLRLKAAKQKGIKKDQEKTTDTSAGRRAIVVIDPGHGGEDYGAKSPDGEYEKDVVLAVALELRELLQSDPQIAVRLTREDDRFVPLFERTTFANDFDADLFVSLHNNASVSGSVRGLQMYVLDNSSDSAATTLAERENSVVRFEGPEADLQYMLSDMIQDAKQPDSLAFADTLAAHIGKSVQKGGAPKMPSAIHKAPFYVLVGAHMPCALAELYFLDNPADAQLLSQATFRRHLAVGLRDGIRTFLKSKALLDVR